MRVAAANGWIGINAILFAAILTAQPVYAQNEPDWHNFEEALTIADSTHKPILVDVGAPWCGWCHKMKNEVYPNLGEDLNRRYIFTRLNRDDKQGSYYYGDRLLSPWEITRKLGVQNIPAVVILNEAGEYVTHLNGYMEADILQKILQHIASRLEEEGTKAITTRSG